MKAPANTLEFVVGCTCWLALSSITNPNLGHNPNPKPNVPAATDADVFAGENMDGLAAVTTPLEFTLSSPWEEPMPFC